MNVNNPDMRIVIVPDLYESESAWHNVVEALHARNFTVDFFTYDPPRDEDTLPIAEELVDYLIDETIILSSGIGGKIALQLAAQRPHQLAHTIVMSAPLVAAPSPKQRFKSFFHTVVTPIRILLPYQLRKKLATKILRLRLGSDKQVLYHSIATGNIEAFFIKISSPVLLLWPYNKTPISPRVAEAAHKKLETSDIRLVSEAHGLLHQTQPELVADTVLALAHQRPIS